MPPLEQQSDADIRATLIASARTLVARDGKLSLPRLYAESGIARAGFLRCFANKEALLAAIVNGDVQVLGEISQAMQPPAAQRLAQAGSQAGNLAVAPSPPPVDAWLERRLRVFERALSALESRQEKSERDLARNVSLLEEKLAAAPVMDVTIPVQDVVFAPASPAAPAAQTLLSRALTQAAVTPPPDAPILPDTPDMQDMDVVFAETPEPQSPSAAEEPVCGREIDDFIAQARVAAQRAAQQKAEPSHGFSLPRWIGWMGLVAVSLLVCAGLALGTVARATQNDTAAALRAQPQDALGRMMALADSGDARAQTALALAYLRGRDGAPNDDAAALRWGLAAARQGVPMAQYVIGTLYGKQDAARAFSWFEQAALRGNIKAMHNLAIAFAQGRGTAEDDRRAAAWFNRAAQQNYVDSQFDLAVMFERGQGVTQNRVAALKWYLIAARGGDGPSRQRAEQLRAEMPQEETERAQEMALAWHPRPRDLAANAVYSP